MSLGNRISRPLTVLAALAWILAALGLAGAAYADTVTPSGAAPAAAGEDHASVDASAHSSSGASADSHADVSSSDHSHGTAGTAGDPSDPQPISKADANTGGANGQCPGGAYCSTRDGSPSGNGNGVGKATGKPCAGCVGKADNKNPRGQRPDGSDHNAGYECDTNHGIGRTNPAHTGCASTTPPGCVPTEANPCVTPPECVPTEANPCVTPPECVPSATQACGPSSTVVSAPAAQAGPLPPAGTSAPPARTLPNTGAPADLGWLAATAVASLVAGAGLLLRRRRLRVGVTES